MTRSQVLSAMIFAALVGCEAKSPVAHSPKAGTTGGAAVKPAGQKDEVAAERAKLSDEERKLVDAQEWCAVANDSRLGSMGAPIKVMLKDQPVFLCCKSCEKKALADPDKTLAKVAELKEKVAKAAKPAEQPQAK